MRIQWNVILSERIRIHSINSTNRIQYIMAWLPTKFFITGFIEMQQYQIVYDGESS